LAVSFSLRSPLRLGLFAAALARPCDGAAPEALAPPPAALEDLLSAARRVLRESGPRPAGRDAFSPLETAALFRLRFQMARASSALAAGDPATAAELAASLDTSPLGLPGLAPYGRLLARVAMKKELSPAAALVAFAEGEAFEPLAREALGEAARRARTAEEKKLVRAAWAAHGHPEAEGPRAAIARALALARVAESERAAREHRWALAARFPDAPERAADDFDDIDLKDFTAAVKGANETIRIGRARALAVRAPDEAKVLLSRVGARPENRLALAETRFLLGEMKDVLRLLQGPGSRGDAATAAHVAALEISASLHLVERTRAVRTGRQPRGRAAEKVAGSPPLSGKDRKEALERLSSLDAVLALPLSESDRRRLLGDGLKVWLRLERHPDARRLLEALLKLGPMSSTGGEEFFQEAFAAYAAGRFMDAARLWDEQLSVYRDVWVRRRATYWAGRARERAGDLEGARALWASLVPGTSADVYARWASAALGVPLATMHGTPSAAAGDVEGLSGDHAAAPSRELLACGFPDLAEDAAENEGSLDPLFGAALASEWGDHRRAVSLLKQRYPEVGTPEEGAVPIAARRAYYPLARAGLVTRAAAEAGLPAALVFGVIRQESIFQTSVKSHAGALGLMQIMPATGRALRRGENRKGRLDLLDPGENVRLGVVYLAQLLRQFGGDTAAALVAYNAGPSRVKRWRKEHGNLPEDEFLESLPLSEPRVYVKRVLFYQGAYAALWGLDAAPPPPSSVAVETGPLSRQP
jgi:soluble lytic murein transglycosylase-like protein